MRCLVSGCLPGIFNALCATTQHTLFFQPHQQNGDGRRRDARNTRSLADRGWFVIVKFGQNDILSYTVSFENYTGGAHGSHAYNNHVINLKTGNAITEEDIFIENFQDSLAQILIDHIAKQNKVENPKDLENIGFFSVEEIFPNGNFLVDGDGITYTFNEYEIAAYVVRETNVFLPYAEIQYLLKKDSPIYQLTMDN